MRRRITAFLVGVALLISAGCTHIALQRRTVKQASTLTDLQYQQVLDNLAMFACTPDALPWHVKLKGGTVQIADQGSGGFSADIAAGAEGEPTRLFPAASASRGIVNQWDLEPAASADDLELLTLAYQKTVKPFDPELDVSIRLAIWQLVATYEIAPGSELLLDILIDAVREEAKSVDEQLMLAQAQSPSQEIDYARTQLARAFEGLVELVNKERLGEPVWSAKQIATFVHDAVDQFKAAEQPLAAAIATVHEPSVLELLKRVRRRVCSITQKEGEQTLAETIPSINQFRDSMREREADEPSPRPALVYTAFLMIAGNEKYLVSQVKPKAELRNPGLIDQAEAKLGKLKELLEEKNSQSQWLCAGQKKDIPKCACYVGHYCGCGGETYVWVVPDQMKRLSEFTLTVLTLAPLEAQDIRGGAAFSPSLR